MLCVGLAHAEKSPGDSLGRRHRIGFLSGYGDESLLKVSYRYYVVFFKGHYSYRLVRGKGWGIEVLATPQYSLTRYRSQDNVPALSNGYESGLNIGVSIDKSLFRERLFLYVLGSAGAHYISGAPERQTNGFIFSDNVVGGLRIRLSKSLMFDFRAGFRHLSNANLVLPNGGIDAVTFTGGLLFMLP